MNMPLIKTERTEWARAAQSLYARGCKREAHLLSACAAKDVIPLAQFDRAAAAYRVWLCYDQPKSN